MNNVCEFLMFKFNEGESSSLLNCARSVFSFFLAYDFEFKNVTIERLFRFFYRERPQKAKYFTYWPVRQLLNFLATHHPPSSLSLKELTLKTFAFIALSSSDRGQSIHQMNVDKTAFSDGKIEFVIDSRLKHTRRILKPKVITCLPSENPALNISEYTRAYLNKTLPLRAQCVTKGLEKPTQLFLSWSTKKPVTRQTLARWLKCSLELAVIDTKQFKAHSYKGAGLSHAYAHGANLHDIVEAGSWTNVGTFFRHYLAPSSSSDVGQIILNGLNNG